MDFPAIVLEDNPMSEALQMTVFLCVCVCVCVAVSSPLCMYSIHFYAIFLQPLLVLVNCREMTSFLLIRHMVTQRKKVSRLSLSLPISPSPYLPLTLSASPTLSLTLSFPLPPSLSVVPACSRDCCLH